MNSQTYASCNKMAQIIYLKVQSLNTKQWQFLMVCLSIINDVGVFFGVRGQQQIKKIHITV